MPRSGFIIETMGERARIKAGKRGFCAGCSREDSCPEGAVQESVADVVEALNPVGAQLGDFVEFDLPGHMEVKLSLLVWGFPLVGLLAGAAVGHALGSALGCLPELAGPLGAVAGLASGLAPVVVCERRAAGYRFLPVIGRVVTTSCASPLASSERAPRGRLRLRD